MTLTWFLMKLSKTKRDIDLKGIPIGNNFFEGTNSKIGLDNSVIFKIKSQKVLDLFVQFLPCCQNDPFQ